MRNVREDERVPRCLQVWLSLRLLGSAKPLFRIWYYLISSSLLYSSPLPCRKDSFCGCGHGLNPLMASECTALIQSRHRYKSSDVFNILPVPCYRVAKRISLCFLLSVQAGENDAPDTKGILPGLVSSRF